MFVSLVGGIMKIIIIYLYTVGMIKVAKTYVSNSGPWGKFGPKFNYNWPARSYKMCIRAGPRIIPYLLLQI